MMNSGTAAEAGIEGLGRYIRILFIAKRYLGTPLGWVHVDSYARLSRNGMSTLVENGTRPRLLTQQEPERSRSRDSGPSRKALVQFRLLC